MGDNKKEIENKEIHDSFGERFKALLSSFKRDDLTNVDIYNKIYGNKNIDDSSKKNKISNLRNGKTVTLDDLIAISRAFDISLDRLVFGKEKTPARDTKGNKKNTPSEEDAYVHSLRLKKIRENKQAVFINNLLNTDHPVLQACSGFLNLLTYANVSIVGDFDIDSMDIPQTLTLKITPICCFMRGYFGENEERSKFFIQYPWNKSGTTEGKKKMTESSQNMLFWDFRATLIQRLIAMSLDSVKKHYFDASKLLESTLAQMKKNQYCEYPSGINGDTQLLTHFTIHETIKKYIMRYGFLPVVRRGWLPPFALDYCSVSLDENFFTDSLVCIRFCEAEKAPSDLITSDIRPIY